MDQTAEQMVIRKAAYWHRLTGSPETANTATVTVHEPKANLFDAKALRQLLGVEATA